MKTLFELFEIVTSIPRCSFKSEKMRDFLVKYAKEFGFSIEMDKAENILCIKGEPKVCLQSHYDMVCLGDAPDIKILKYKNIIKAKHSTLGADNGIGVAIMLYCMQKYSDLEVLFTANEEVGLIGAANLELDIRSPYILNLDGESEDEIYIGCAGGKDIISYLSLEYENLDADDFIYEIIIENLPGGHSGVDIDKNIPSAIKLLAKFLYTHECELIDIKGGERRNSIPQNAKAIFTCKNNSLEDENFNIRKLSEDGYKKIKGSKSIIYALEAFANGVRSYDKELDIVSTSVNIGTIGIKDDLFEITASARAMKDNDMSDLLLEIESFFLLSGFRVNFGNGHGAWSPDIGEFSYLVKSIMDRHLSNAEFKAIHAGLECGILISRQKDKKEAVSIGPNIRYPHSLREECEWDSVERIKEIVEEVICQ